jgi:hypothetical protein
MARRAVQEEQTFWNGVALLVFVALCGVAVWLIAHYGAVAPASFGFLDLALLGLATFRLIHLQLPSAFRSPTRRTLFLLRVTIPCAMHHSDDDNFVLPGVNFIDHDVWQPRHYPFERSLISPDVPHLRECREMLNAFK